MRNRRKESKRREEIRVSKKTERGGREKGESREKTRPWRKGGGKKEDYGKK